MKKIVKLTENDLVNIIKRVINEGRTYTYDDAWEKAFKEKVYNPCNLYSTIRDPQNRGWIRSHVK